MTAVRAALALGLLLLAIGPANAAASPVADPMTCGGLDHGVVEGGRAEPCPDSGCPPTELALEGEIARGNLTVRLRCSDANLLTCVLVTDLSAIILGDRLLACES